jgi:3-dehydroquinate synthase
MSGRRDRFVQSFSVPFQYPVCFCHGLFAPGNRLLEEAMGPREGDGPHRALVYVDDGLARASSRLVPRIARYFAARAGSVRLAAPPRLVPGGEPAKSSERVARRVMEDLRRHHFCRHSYVIAIGGGSVLDAVGFAAALVHRGVRLIRVPTTVLAQNDVGVGVKNGLNQDGTKNFLGTFAPPHAVLIDFDFLRTLDTVHWRAGIAEAIKVALIKDATFFCFLEQNAAKLKRRNQTAMETLIRRCAALHLDHIREGNDPFERGAARPLDFGHWAAHKLESLSGYAIGHGQAVAIGMALDSVYAARVGLIKPAARDRILALIERCGLPVWDSLLGVHARRGRLSVLAGLDDFREHLGGKLSITLPSAIGRQVQVHEMDEAQLVRSVEELRARAGK